MHAGSFAMSLQLFFLNLGKIHKVSASWKLHIPPLYPEESALFSVIIFTQNFYVFRTQSQYISLFLVIFMMPISTSHDKDRTQSKYGRMLLKGEMPCWFIRKVKYLLCFLQNCFPLPLCCCCTEPTH